MALFRVQPARTLHSPTLSLQILVLVINVRVMFVVAVEEAIVERCER